MKSCFSTKRTIELGQSLFTAHNRHTMTSATLKRALISTHQKKEKSRRECFMIRRQFDWIRSAAWRCRLLIVAFGKRYCHAKVDTRKLKATRENVMKWFMDSWFQFSLSLRCTLPRVPHTIYNKWNETILTQLNRQEIMANLFGAVTRRISRALFLPSTLILFIVVVGVLLLLWLVKFVQLALLLAGFYLFASSELSDDQDDEQFFNFPQTRATCYYEIFIAIGEYSTVVFRGT